MQYDELTQALQDYLETDETTFVDNIPVFVRAVENRVYNEVNLPSLRKNSSGSLAANDRYMSMPEDFLGVSSLALIDVEVGEHIYLLMKDVHMVRELYPSPTATGVPKFFGLYEPQTLLIGPTPAKEYQVELHYFYYPESLVTAGTSWLADNFESVVLYGVIAEGYRFLKGDPAQQQIYDNQYMNALGLLAKTVGQTINFDRYSNKQPRTTGE